jgi:hypothetical protein
MPTAKKRINITLSEDIERALVKAARRDMVPEATKAAALLRVALEIEEDELWEDIAQKRDKKGTRFVSHTQAWA